MFLIGIFLAGLVAHFFQLAFGAGAGGEGLLHLALLHGVAGLLGRRRRA